MSVLDRFRLDGRTAIITGVGPGVGEHVAKAYAELGANVVISARSADRLERIVGEIKAAGGKALAVPADVTKLPDLENLVAKARAAFGPIHIVFNNAAAGIIPIEAGVWDNNNDVWEEAVASNMRAPYHMARLTFPDMEVHGKGSFITVESCGGFTPLLPNIAYGVAKAGLAMLTRHLAKAMAPAARVNSICIGSMSPDGQEADIHKGYNLSAKNAIKRFGAAHEAVGAAILLAGDGSTYTTGSVIYVEGGRVGTLS